MIDKETQGDKLLISIKDRMNLKLKNKIDPDIEIKPCKENLRCCTCGHAFGFRDNRGQPVRHRVVKNAAGTKVHICDRCLILAHLMAEKKRTGKLKAKKGYIDARRGT